MLVEKVDKTELEQMDNNKSNKSDTQLTLKAIELLHKQVMHVVVLLIEVIKTMIPNAQENEKVREKKKLYNLQSAVSVCKWALRFDPYNTN